MEVPNTNRAKDAIRIMVVNKCRHRVALTVVMTAGMEWDRTSDKDLFIDPAMDICRHAISIVDVELEDIQGMGVSKILNSN